jgi:tRNA-Thr(GGU) m(6)t(6)A37 methyltransferase TsaA
MELKVIAHACNGHTDKFGIPRQSREESPIVTRIVFEPAYSVREALRGIEGFSHLWLIWGFSETANAEWSPTVRPPRLGGNTRMGVFATRSPFRPNPIGLTSVRLIDIRTNGKSMELLVSGADLMDGTPIYDIKPYLAFSDSHPEAVSGFAEQTKGYRLRVTGYGITESSDIGVPEETMRDIIYILRQDPRPAYQDDPDREYKMDYAGWNVTFCVTDRTAVIKKVQKMQK